jgi:hypothetical protein
MYFYFVTNKLYVVRVEWSDETIAKAKTREYGLQSVYIQERDIFGKTRYWDIWNKDKISIYYRNGTDIWYVDGNYVTK